MYLLKPEKVLLFGWLNWLFFWLISPYIYQDLGNFLFASLTLILFNISFVLGIKSVPFKISNHERIETLQIKSKLFFISVILSIFGFILNVFSKLSVIGSINMDNLASNKAQILESGELTGGILSVISGITHPFSLIVFIITLYNRNNLSRAKFFFFIGIGTVNVIFLILMGSRTLLFFHLFIMFFVVRITYKQTVSDRFIKIQNAFQFIKKIKLKRIFLILFSLILLVRLYASIQKDGMNYNGENISFFEYWSVNQKWKYNEHHPINILITNPEENINYLSFIHYQVHGVYEYSRNITKLDRPEGMYYGIYELFPIYKMLGIFGLNENKNFTQINEPIDRVGVYTTFWGPFYYDFGLFGVILIFFIGRLVASIRNKFYSYSKFHQLLYPVVLTTIFVSPVINTVNGIFLYYYISIFLSMFFINKKQK